MKTEIPNALKTDVPQTTWGKLLLATPVVMTVIATMLAGLASSEMTRAQYDRAYAAQLQAKAGDQWSYFQAKKLRGAIQRNSLELLGATADVRPLDTNALQRAGVPLDSATVHALADGTLPAMGAKLEVNAAVKAALEAVESGKPESDVSGLLARVSSSALEAELKAARETAARFDELTRPVNQAIDRLANHFVAGDRALNRDFVAVHLRFAAARYELEARLNQAIANLLELQVRKNNISAERHHRRSGNFFFGMLAAQAAVIVSTFSLAAQKRNFLWSVAAVAGVLAIAFAVYVYLYV